MNASLRVIAAALLLFTASAACSAGDVNYAVSAIPSSLLPADAVVRVNSRHLTIRDQRRSRYDVVYAVTIFSKSEQHYGALSLPYNEYTSIDDLSGTIYDAAGEEIRDLTKDDIKDYSDVDYGTLASNERVRSVTLIHDAYPYTVEYRYTLKFDGSLQWPMWSAQTDKFPVESTSFAVTAPNDFPLRTWCNTPGLKPDSTTDGSDVTYTWKRSLLPLLSDDEAVESMFDITTVVKVAPVRFQMETIEGSMASWKELGAWYRHLYKDKQVLPDDAIREVRLRTASCATEREKIRALYTYMQSRTRYVSIQLGIGGWSPFDASFVHTKGYGDCKALTNYMGALLHAAGIVSYPVHINSGINRIDMIEEFPSYQFDHVILCVPQGKDTVWLECTSQSAPFGRLGDFTENRTALLDSDSGGIVVHTPPTTAAENLQRRTVTASIATTGSITAQITTLVTGDQQLDMQLALLSKSPEKRQAWFLDRLETPNCELTGFSMEGLEDRSPEITVRMTASLERYGALNSARLFFNPSLLSKHTFIPAENRKRKSPVRAAYPYVDIDSIYFSIPALFVPETIPKPVALRSSFGSFTSSTRSMGDTALVYVRRTEVTNRVIPADHYQEYRTFHQEMVKADRAQVVLRIK